MRVIDKKDMGGGLIRHSGCVADDFVKLLYERRNCGRKFLIYLDLLGEGFKQDPNKTLKPRA